MSRNDLSRSCGCSAPCHAIRRIRRYVPKEKDPPDPPECRQPFASTRLRRVTQRSSVASELEKRSTS
eukprot:606229-Pleurochrysis_carterae.AAC.1